MARIGIVGFPNVGKTTLFNALTGLAAPTASHPFSTTEPNLGVARIPDHDLDEIARLERSAKTTHATLELSDLPAMVKPAHSGGPGGHFLGRLREEEALAVVLRAFEDERIPSDESGTDPVAQAQELLLELTLADFEVFDRRKERIAKEAGADPRKRPSAAAIAAAARLLEEGTPLREGSWQTDEMAAFRDLAPLTLKPAVWVINISEDETAAPGMVRRVQAVVPAGDKVAAVSAELEEEASRLSPEDREELLEGFGLGEGAVARIVRAVHEALGLIGFYTVSSRESRAWTIRSGARAPEAAGKIHSDMERGFIRAEVAPIQVVIGDGGWDAAKKAGHVRVEGKNYVVAHRDVLMVRFSV